MRKNYTLIALSNVKLLYFYALNANVYISCRYAIIDGHINMRYTVLKAGTVENQICQWEVRVGKRLNKASPEHLNMQIAFGDNLILITLAGI